MASFCFFCFLRLTWMLSIAGIQKDQARWLCAMAVQLLAHCVKRNAGGSCRLRSLLYLHLTYCGLWHRGCFSASYRMLFLLDPTCWKSTQNNKKWQANTAMLAVKARIWQNVTGKSARFVLQRLACPSHFLIFETAQCSCHIAIAHPQQHGDDSDVMILSTASAVQSLPGPFSNATSASWSLGLALQLANLRPGGTVKFDAKGLAFFCQLQVTDAGMHQVTGTKSIIQIKLTKIH